MKKMFIIGSFLFTPVCSSFCSASREEAFELSKTHKITVNKRGETIFYPKEYSNYEELKKKRITNLLAERLNLLCSFKKLYDQYQETQQFPETEYVNNQGRLTRNEIFLKNNIDKNLLSRIFDNNYSNEKITTDHIINIALALKERLSPTDTNNQEKLQDLIEQVHSWESKAEQAITLGSSSFLAF